MKRSILSPVLGPEQAAWLAQTFDRNRKYAGLRMMADGDPDPADDPKPGDDPKDDPKPGEDPDKLGEGGKKALEAERTRAKTAEDALKAKTAEDDTFKKALLEAFGIKPEGADKSEDALTAVQQQLAAIQRESAVLKLANTHKITDEGDLKILASATDAEQMKALAERLAPAEGDPDAKSRRPRPDRTQGGGSGDDSKTAGGSVAAVVEERRAARAKKNEAKTNV